MQQVIKNMYVSSHKKKNNLHFIHLKKIGWIRTMDIYNKKSYVYLYGDYVILASFK